MEDAARIRRLLEGDPEVIGEVRTWIRGSFTPYRTRLRDDLEDLEQDVLIALSDALRAGKFSEKSSLRTYVRSYAHHKCLDRLRSKGRREWVDVEGLEIESGRPTALEDLTREEATRLALRVLDSMPEGCREMWTMIHQGKRYREMSEHFGIAEGTLRVRVLRCRQKALEAREKFLREKL
ncbi:MAG: sigma-70 family RNA polymerase sigma factor [Acidobacteriota bacterium]